MDFPYAAYAEMIGLRGYRVEKPEEVGVAWDQALSADRPCVLDVVTDPNVPPLPPHITYEQAKSYAQSLLKGDPEAVGIVWQSIKEAMAGVLPGRR
jgi:pyruvate dehydrogenase (quinone)